MLASLNFNYERVLQQLILAGETAPGLLKDYNVPHLFQEDFLSVLVLSVLVVLSVLDRDQRPPGLGEAPHGRHVDPALTSAWNTLALTSAWNTWPGKVDTS